MTTPKQNPHALSKAMTRLPCRLWLLLACMPAVLPGQTTSAPTPAPSAQMLLKYDKNKNGKLDPDELAALQADEAKASKAPVETREDDTGAVELSPFQVNVEGDKGYLASNTLSGTRLNSKIEDLGASITVITKQQMLDTAVLDINDIFLYEANTEGTGNYTSFGVTNGGVNDNVQSGPQTANRIRGLDTANTARGNFASNSTIPIDLYNTDGVELSRGPNSNLFGLGNASGTVNIIPSQANVTRSISTLTLRGDSYGGYRTSIDLNRPVLRNKLAIRLSAVYLSTGYERKPSTDVTKRQQGAVTYKPFSKTTIRGTYESYFNYARRPNSITPRDTVTYWKASGSPTWDPTTQKVTINGVEQPTVYPQSPAVDGTLPPGLLAQGSGFYNRPSIYVDKGAIQYWSVNRTGTVPTTGLFAGIPTPDNPNTNIRFLESGNEIQRFGPSFPLFVQAAITNKALYDWSSVNFVAPDYFRNKADIYTAEIEQTILSSQHHTIAARAGWYRERFSSYSRNFINGNNAVLFVDVNLKLLDGQPNPYFLRPYLAASEPTLTNNPNINDIQSADLAYQLKPSNLPKWFSWIGQQNVVAHGETRRIDTAMLRYRDFILDDHTWLNPLDRAGGTVSRAYYKYYVGDNQGQNVDYAPPPVYSLGGRNNLTWFNALTNQWVNESALIGQGGVTTSNRMRREIRTVSLATQNFFLDNRLVTTFGWRKDKNRNRDSNNAFVDPATGLINYTPLKTWLQWNDTAGSTKTAGVVVKPFSWLSAHYNQSDSFQPAATQYSLFAGILPNPTGKGKDYGVTFNLFKDKLVVKINKYESFQVNSRNGVGTQATRSIQLDTVRVDNGSAAYNFESWATNLSNTRFAAQGILPTAAQTDSAVAKIMGLPEGFLNSVIGHSIAETSDVAAKGYEFELNYNPNRNWTLKATAAQQITIDSNLSPNIQKYIDMRLPIWTTAKDDAGALWWTTNNGGIPQNFYTGSISAPLKLAIANQGKPRSQVREWRFNALTNYNFTQGRLKNFGVGGAVRWEDKASIGFLGGAPDADGVVRTLDPNKPLFDKSRYAFDLLASYNLRVYQGRIRARIQLNVRDIFERGRLQAVAVNPDGQPYAYRIIDPRQFILSTTFDL